MLGKFQSIVHISRFEFIFLMTHCMLESVIFVIGDMKLEMKIETEETNGKWRRCLKVPRHPIINC